MTKSKSKSKSKTKTKSKSPSLLNLNTFLNNNSYKSKKTNTHKKQSHTPTQKSIQKSIQKSTQKPLHKLTNISLDILKKLYNLDVYKNTITSFYALNNPIITYLVKYNDNESKRLNNNGLDSLELVSSYRYLDIEETLKSIDLIYKLNNNLLKDLKLKQIPPVVKYAAEDFTRGIRQFLDARFKHLPINLSNGFVKLWEILHNFKLMDTKDTNHPANSFNVFHIAEAPGQMILCAKYYAEKKHPDITNYEWRANSLNPFNYEVKTKYGALKDEYKLMRHNPDKWLWGADNTGDITRVKNIKWFRNYIDNKWLNKNSKHLDLIIGDGGIGTDTNSIYNLQKLDLAQVVNVIACSSVGGSCVIKHFTSYMIDKPETIESTSFFISFIYLYYVSFEEVNLFKPYTSDSTSGEFYVIGKGFKGIENQQLDKLYDILNKFKTNNAIFPREALPDTYIKQIYNFLDLMTKLNIKGYEKQNLLLNCYKEVKNKDVKQSKKKTKLKNLKYDKNTDTDTDTDNINCEIYLDENNIKNILTPRYNQWININEFE